MRVLCFLLACIGSAVAAADDLQSVLDRHLGADVPYWLAEPRLVDLLRDASRRDPALDNAAVAGMEQRWREEMAGDGGELTDHVASRFASNYLAEVALRLDGAYGPVLVLDNRGLVTAASELPDRLDFSDDPCVKALADHADAPWAEDRKPATGSYTHVAMPVRDADGNRVGTLLLDIDVSRLPAEGLADGDTRRHDDARLSVRAAAGKSPVVR